VLVGVLVVQLVLVDKDQIQSFQQLHQRVVEVEELHQVLQEVQVVQVGEEQLEVDLVVQEIHHR
jgi:hypothetical protein